jgi:lipoate-protein ligase A
MPQISWRLIDSGIVPPPESAALDEAILEAHIAGDVPNTLHFYRRDRPTISIGYFQKVVESVDVAECERQGVALVRRKSGGSSIFTDPGQLIYSLVVHEDDLPSERSESFRLICNAIAKALGTFGVDAVYRPVNDVEVGGMKISGNAQLRRKGSVLQHGTIIVDTDMRQADSVLRVLKLARGVGVRPSTRVTTLATLIGSVPDYELVKGALVFAFGEAFNVKFVSSPLCKVEDSLVRKLVRELYGRKEWTFKN